MKLCIYLFDENNMATIASKNVVVDVARFKDMTLAQIEDSISALAYWAQDRLEAGRNLEKRGADETEQFEKQESA